MTPPGPKPGMHPRNRFRNGYDFAELCAVSAPLRPFVVRNPHGGETVDYANPAAVKALNQALLRKAYGLEAWDLPPGHLCPPVPGRSDYIHCLADLLAAGGPIPEGPQVSVLDIGTGANVIYPLVGASEYGWRFVGAELDAHALTWAQKLVAANPSVSGLIECRRQHDAQQCFEGVVHSGEHFAASMCNPPFHASAAEAREGSQRKATNLSKGKRTRGAAPVLNFGGKSGELWCPGGELGFVRRMVAQSAQRPNLCRWFTTLISKSSHLPALQTALQAVRVAEVRVIPLAQGQKQSRILAWSFLS